MLSQKQVQITYATELASSDVSVYTLMKLLGHESMTTSQRYVTAAGTETRSAASLNPLYALIPNKIDSSESSRRDPTSREPKAARGEGGPRD